MKILLTALLCLFLLGCTDPTDVSEASTEPTAAAASVEAAASLETQYGSAVQAIPLPLQRVSQICKSGGGFLLSSGNQLILLDDQLRFTAAAELEFEAQIQCAGPVTAAFDPGSRQLLLLDGTLQELRRVTLPGALSGSPVLNSSADTLYYCTSNAIYCWDLEGDIRRRIKEVSNEAQTLVSLCRQDTVLQYRSREGNTLRDQFLDASDGHLLKEMATEVSLFTTDSSYFCTYAAGLFQNLVFGTDGEDPRGLFPDPFASEAIFLPEQNAAVTQCAQSDGSIRMDAYCLDTGALQDSLILSDLHHPKSILSYGENTILLLIYDPEYDCDLLLQWCLRDTPLEKNDHTDLYYTNDDADHAGLSLCQSYAQTLSERFGVDILIWKDAAAVEPWDYRFEAEYQYPVILQQLQTLEQCLSRYPLRILSDTAAHFDSLKICLVRQISGTRTDESLTTATGIQFFSDNDAYVVIAAGQYAEQALYHELFHVMETHILSTSSALDRWNDLNPAGFSYDLDYSANARRNSGVYLENGTRAFVDTYSMSYPKEDRARIFEYAMLPDQAYLFQSATMQSKLTALCSGIRESYGLPKSDERFPWEQYLDS